MRLSLSINFRGQTFEITKFYYSVVKEFDIVFLTTLHHNIHVVCSTGI